MSVRFSRLLALAGLTIMFVAAFAVSAFAQPNIAFVKYTNAIAYDLKSMQATRFYTRVDTANVWAKLKVRTPYGDKYIYKGAIKDANATFYFPPWDGKGPHGEKLPSSTAYQWTLAVNKGDQTDIEVGRIAVTRVLFSRTLAPVGVEFFQLRPSLETYDTAYMRAGSYTCYVTAVSSAPSTFTPNPAAVGFWVNNGTPVYPNQFRWPFPVGATIREVGHGDGARAIDRAGVHNFSIIVSQPSTVCVTFMQ